MFWKYFLPVLVKSNLPVMVAVFWCVCACFLEEEQMKRREQRYDMKVSEEVIGIGF